jgi:hypothetical protein
LHLLIDELEEGKNYPLSVGAVGNSHEEKKGLVQNNVLAVMHKHQSRACDSTWDVITFDPIYLIALGEDFETQSVRRL